MSAVHSDGSVNEICVDPISRAIVCNRWSFVQLHMVQGATSPGHMGCCRRARSASRLVRPDPCLPCPLRLPSCPHLPLPSSHFVTLDTVKMTEEGDPRGRPAGHPPLPPGGQCWRHGQRATRQAVSADSAGPQGRGDGCHPAPSRPGLPPPGRRRDSGARRHGGTGRTEAPRRRRGAETHRADSAEETERLARDPMFPTARARSLAPACVQECSSL